MRRVLVLAALLVLVWAVGAGADEADSLEQGRALLHGPRHEEGVALLRRTIRDGQSGTLDAPALHRIGRAHFYLEEDKEAIAAFERAAKLEPENVDHHYWLGLVWKYSDLDKAVASFQAATKLDLTSARAWHELGRAWNGKQEAEKALAALLKASKHAPDDLRLHAKVVQALYALERYEETTPWREKILAIRAGQTKEEKAKQREFCFDQFMVGDQRVYAFEPFDQEGSIRYLAVFRVTKDGKNVQRINLELSRVIEDLGGPAYVLGGGKSGDHVTYDRAWRERPPYPELEQAVIDALQGRIAVAARSRTTPEGSEIEIGR